MFLWKHVQHQGRLLSVVTWQKLCVSVPQQETLCCEHSWQLFRNMFIFFLCLKLEKIYIIIIKITYMLSLSLSISLSEQRHYKCLVHFKWCKIYANQWWFIHFALCVNNIAYNYIYIYIYITILKHYITQSI